MCMLTWNLYPQNFQKSFADFCNIQTYIYIFIQGSEQGVQQSVCSYITLHTPLTLL